MAISKSYFPLDRTALDQTELVQSFKKTKYVKNGDAGYQSPYLSHAKLALYHLSYIPLIFHFRKLFYNVLSI
ncbi:hypothetical protein GQ457_06G008720 [Hibiscus cannabinus]